MLPFFGNERLKIFEKIGLVERLIGHALVRPRVASSMPYIVSDGKKSRESDY
jgi:hypothetical protein